MSGSVRIKFCGIRSVADAQAAVEAGADLIGLNFVAGSPREVDLRQAEEICREVESLPVERVALFRDAGWEDIEHVLCRCVATLAARVRFWPGDVTTRMLTTESETCQKMLCARYGQLRLPQEKPSPQASQPGVARRR